MEHVEGARRDPAGIGSARAYDLVRKELFGEFGADFFKSYIDPLRLVAEVDPSGAVGAGVPGVRSAG